MKVRYFLVLFFLSCFYASGNDGYKRNPSIDIINYNFSLSLSDTSNTIYGHTLITVSFLNKSGFVVFDLKGKSADGKGMTLSNVSFDGSSVKWIHDGNKITITPEKEFIGGTRGIFTIDYSGIPADGLIISDNKFGKRTFFADNWPDRGRNWLPCIDHPYDKATVDFIVTSPDHYEVVGSGHLVEEACLPHNTKLTHWKEDIPLAVKVMAIGVADFAARFEGNVDQIPVWSWVFTQNRNEGYNDYSVGVKPMAFYSQLIGPYSYEKLANVQSKTIFGGLENAGCIFYAENSVTGKGTVESLMAHEIAHQWFGNSVTENDWHHVWLSEGFATYLTDMYLEKTYGRQKLNDELKAERNRVIGFYKRSQRPIIDTAVTDLMKLLNPNSYQKGAWVLHMLRRKIGDDLFFEGLSEYYKKYRNSNACTTDFEKVMESIYGKDLSGFFKEWLYLSGHPELKITTTRGRKKGTTDIKIEQTQDSIFSFELELEVLDTEGKEILRIPITERNTIKNVKAENITGIIPDPETDLLFTISPGSSAIIQAQ
jgi:aminopeptidase N